VALAAAQQATKLAREGKRPIRLSLALLVLSQVYLRLGQPDEALTAVQEALRLAQTISPNVSARLLLQRTAVHLYLGQLTAAYNDLRDATRLLESMDDPQASLQLYLLWQEFNQAHGNIVEAQRYLAQANQLLMAQTAEKATSIEAQVRLWIATAQVAHHLKRPDQTEALSQLALKGCQVRHLRWWLPAAHYWLGMAQLAQDETAASREFHQALEAIKRGGNPDMLPLVSLQLALLEKEVERQEQYLVACVKAANIRAIYRERIACFRVAGSLLTAASNPDLRQMGERCLNLVAWFDAEVASTKSGSK
jgi:tetratricopeptide (TPR) repeat protein